MYGAKPKPPASGQEIISGLVGMSYHEILRRGAQHLDGYSSTAALDARVLLSHLLRRNEAWLIAHGGETMAADDAKRYAELLTRRRRGEPVAHIIGSREFWSLTLAVSPSVLIPRPETELLVDTALRRIPTDAEWCIADLGTGSGAVALAIAAERPGCQVVATDCSHDALKVAIHNAQNLAVRNVEFLCGSWCQPLAPHSFHVIVANPPYVADNDPHLQQGDLPHEPPLALRAGPLGLDALAVISTQARESLTAPGWLILEHGFDQPSAVADLLSGSGYLGIQCHRDHAGQPRVTECRLSAKPSDPA